MCRRFISVIFIGAIASWLAPLSAAQETNGRADSTIAAKIRQEEEQHSQIMRTLHFLADVYGPRVTGSPSLKAAGEWAIKTMETWGFTNGHLEPWEFGLPGWVNERLSVHVVSPIKAPLVAEPLAWTPSTNGTVSAAAINIILPEGPLMPEVAGRGRGPGGAPQHFGPTREQLTASHQPCPVCGTSELEGRGALHQGPV